MATTMTVVAVNDELLDVAQRLATEYDDLTAGSVLRCFARAVRRSARSGCPTEQLPGEAERLTRHMLATRRQRGRVALPRQRQSAAITDRGRGAA